MAGRVLETSVGIVGCAGRMGRMLVQEVHEVEACRVGGGTVRPGSPRVGRDVGEIAGVGAVGVAASDDPARLFAECDAVIDFTTPDATAGHAVLAAQGKAVYVVGTTGLGKAEQEALDKAAKHTAIVQASNTSLGVTLLTALVGQVAGLLGNDFDIEILEMHHRHKVDAPSGTALALGRAAAAARGVDLEKIAARARDGHTGPRRPGDIGFAVLRGGDVTGEHRVIFAGEGERIELTHKASSRRLFARGAVRAALWARGKPSGLYGMKDVLGLD